MHSDIRDASTIREAFRYQGIPPLESVTMYIYIQEMGQGIQEWTK